MLEARLVLLPGGEPLVLFLSHCVLKGRTWSAYSIQFAYVRVLVDHSNPHLVLNRHCIHMQVLMISKKSSPNPLSIFWYPNHWPFFLASLSPVTTFARVYFGSPSSPIPLLSWPQSLKSFNQIQDSSSELAKLGSAVSLHFLLSLSKENGRDELTTIGQKIFLEKIWGQGI